MQYILITAALVLSAICSVFAYASCILSKDHDDEMLAWKIGEREEQTK